MCAAAAASASAGASAGASANEGGECRRKHECERKFAGANDVLGNDTGVEDTANNGNESEVVAAALTCEDEVASGWSGTKVEHALPAARLIAGEGEGSDERNAFVEVGNGMTEVEVAAHVSSLVGVCMSTRAWGQQYF